MNYNRVPVYYCDIHKVKIIAALTVITVVNICEANAQTNIIGSAHTIPVSGINSVHQTQSDCILSGFMDNFYDEASLKGQNDGVGVHTWLTTDFTNDDYCDLFLSFFTMGEVHQVPSVLLVFDEETGLFVDESHRIENNVGQSFNRKSMAADLNGDGVKDIVMVSHPEKPEKILSYLDLIMSDGIGGWHQQTRLIGSRDYPNSGDRPGYWHGVALGDVDNDGDIDIYVANWRTTDDVSFILENDGSGDFTERDAFDEEMKSDPQRLFRMSHFTSELADLNGDGFIDLLASPGNTIIYGDGSGVFKYVLRQDIPSGSWLNPNFLILDYDIADLDNDNDDDIILLLSDYINWQFAFLINNGIGANGFVEWDDMSEVVNEALLGQGFYTDSWSLWPNMYMQVSDINGDGSVDIIPQRNLGGYGNAEWVLLKDPNGMTYDYVHYPLMRPVTNLSGTSSGSDVTLTWSAPVLESGDAIFADNWLIYSAPAPFGDTSLATHTFQTTEYSFTQTNLMPGSTMFFRIVGMGPGGIPSPLSNQISVSLASGVDTEPLELPETFVLKAAYPNPFNPTTTVTYGLPAAAEVRITATDLLGRQVAALVAGDMKAAGYHTVQFNADGLASGTYLIRMEAGDVVATQQVVLLK